MIKKALNYGILSGVILVAYHAILYAGGMKIFSNWWLALLTYVIAIALMVIFANKVKKQNPASPFPFADAFMVTMTIGTVASLVFIIWNILLFNVIDTGLGAELSDRIIEQTMEMMEKWNTPEKAMDDAMAEMAHMEDGFKPAGMLITWAKGLIFYAIVSAIVALIIKKKNTTPANASIDMM